MRTYDIIDEATGAVLRRETVDDAIRPTLLHGQAARPVNPFRLTDRGEALLTVSGGVHDSATTYATDVARAVQPAPDPAEPHAAEPHAE